MLRFVANFSVAVIILLSGGTVHAQQASGASGQWHSTYECKSGSKQLQFRLDIAIPSHDETLLFVRHYQKENGNWSLYRDVILQADAPLNPSAQRLDKIHKSRGVRATSFAYHPAQDRLVSDFDNCKNVTLQRVQLDSPAPVLGNWEIAFDGCRMGRSAGALSGTANIELISDGSFAADLEFTEKTEDEGKGRALYLGSFDPGRDTLRLNEATTARTLRDGSRRTSRSSPNDLELRINADGSLSGVSQNCREATFYRQGQKPTVMAASEVLAGEWEGRATCGKQFPVLMTLQEPTGTRINGEISYFPENAVSGGSFKQKLVGEFDAEARQARLVIAEQPRLIGGPRSFAPGEFVLSSGPENGSWTATYSGGSCSTMTVSPVTEDSLSRQPTVMASDGGAYFSARDTRGRCEAAAAWLAKFETEYPRLANVNTSTDQLYPRMVLLFADDDFVPVFGQAFDTMPLDQRRQAANEINNQCARDPLFRSEFELFSTVSRALRQDPDRPLASFGIPAVFQSIRNTRVLHHEYASAMAGINNQTPLEEAASKLSAILSDLQSHANIVWPSEHDDMTAEIDAVLGNLAWRDAQIAFENLSAMTKTNEQLSKMTAAARGNTPYHQFLSDTERGKLRSDYASAQNKIVAPILQPVMNDVEALPESLDSFPRLDSSERSTEPTLALILDEVAHPYRSVIEHKRTALFENLVRAAWRELEEQPETKAGLAMGAAWLDKFESDFAIFSERQLYDATIARFRLKRNQMLANVVSEFVHEARQAKAIGKGEMLPEIMAAYLTSDVDKKLPASLEYDIVLRSLQ